MIQEAHLDCNTCSIFMMKIIFGADLCKTKYLEEGCIK